MFPMSDELNGRSNSLLAELISVILDVDDDIEISLGSNR